MASRDGDNSRFILNSWYILPLNRGELNHSVRFLKANLNINMELNSYAPEGNESDGKIIDSENFTALDASDHLISEGIDKSRIKCDHLAGTKLPMFRFVRVD